MKKALTAIILGAAMLVPSGCKKAGTTTPPQAVAPGYNGPSDQTLGTTLKGIHDFYTGLMKRIAADNRVLSPAENTALTSLAYALNIADTTYVAYHNGTATLQQAQTAVSNASAAQSNVQSQVKP